jgi:hypothetical protein
MECAFPHYELAAKLCKNELLRHTHGTTIRNISDQKVLSFKTFKFVINA